jgi:hypothetical protein
MVDDFSLAVGLFLISPIGNWQLLLRAKLFGDKKDRLDGNGRETKETLTGLFFVTA